MGRRDVGARAGRDPLNPRYGGVGSSGVTQEDQGSRMGREIGICRWWSRGRGYRGMEYLTAAVELLPPVASNSVPLLLKCTSPRFHVMLETGPPV